MPIYTAPDKDLKILFVHIPKCGGGSVELFLRSNGFSQSLYSIDHQILSAYKCSPQHWHAELLSKVLDIEKFDYVFAIARDPYERLLSEYRWRICHPLAADGFDDWYRIVRIKYLENNYFYDNHLRKQVDFLLPGLKVFRLEDSLELAMRSMVSELQLSLDFKFLLNQKKGVRWNKIKSDPRLSSLFLESRASSEVYDLIRNDYEKDFNFYETLQRKSYRQV